MKIKLSTDSAMDLNEELTKLLDISVIPFEISVGEEIMIDRAQPTDAVLDKADEYKTLPKTSAINETRFDEYFEKLSKENDAVIHFSLSSGLSITCENAYKSALKFKNVYVVDTLTGSAGMTLLAMHTKKLATEDMPVKEIMSHIQEKINQITIRFVISKIDYLYKGGRCSKLQLLGANLLKFRPTATMSGGQVKSDKKFRGPLNKVVPLHFEDTFTNFNEPNKECAVISYTTCDQPEIIENAKTQLKNAGFKKIHVVQLGATISSHLGRNSFGLAYYNK